MVTSYIYLGRVVSLTTKWHAIAEHDMPMVHLLSFFVPGLLAVHPIFVAYRACAEVKRYAHAPVKVGALSFEKVRD